MHGYIVVRVVWPFPINSDWEDKQRASPLIQEGLRGTFAQKKFNHMSIAAQSFAVLRLHRYESGNGIHKPKGVFFFFYKRRMTRKFKKRLFNDRLSLIPPNVDLYRHSMEDRKNSFKREKSFYVANPLQTSLPFWLHHTLWQQRLLLEICSKKGRRRIHRGTMALEPKPAQFICPITNSQS